LIDFFAQFKFRTAFRRKATETESVKPLSHKSVRNRRNLSIGANSFLDNGSPAPAPDPAQVRLNFEEEPDTPPASAYQQAQTSQPNSTKDKFYLDHGYVTVKFILPQNN
jgi:hypothetical protein